MWINISLHTRVRHLCRGKRRRSKRRRDGTLANIFFKKGEIEMHRESSAIHLPRPVSRLSYSQPTLSGVYHNRGTACEYLSCNFVPVELCVRKRWFTVCGGIGERRTLTVGAVTKCSSQIIPMDQSTARFLRDTQKKSSVTTVPGHACAYHWCEQALIDNCLKSLTRL